MQLGGVVRAEKEKRPVGLTDVNVKQMTMGSWRCNLSKVGTK